MPLARKDTAVGETVQRMNRLLQRLEHSGGRAGRDRIASGCPPLDRLLPQQGFARGLLGVGGFDLCQHLAGLIELALLGKQVGSAAGQLDRIDFDGYLGQPLFGLGQLALALRHLGQRHEGFSQTRWVVLVGVGGEPSHRRVVGAFEHILHVLCISHWLLWLEETILMSPLEHPAAK